MANPGGLLIENYSAYISQNGGINTALPITTTSTLSSGSKGGNSVSEYTPVAINATATATVAQVQAGYITSTSAAATTITLPTATALATQLGAQKGSVFELYIDNSAGANTVTITPGAGMTASAVASVATYGVPTFGLLTVPSGTSGTARFTFVFTSATTCTYTRTA